MQSRLWIHTLSLYIIIFIILCSAYYNIKVEMVIELTHRPFIFNAILEKNTHAYILNLSWFKSVLGISQIPRSLDRNDCTLRIIDNPKCTYPPELDYCRLLKDGPLRSWHALVLLLGHWSWFLF